MSDPSWRRWLNRGAASALASLGLVTSLVCVFRITPGGAEANGLALDLDGSPRRCRAMASVLLSSDPATWHEAQLRLACAGPCALDALERPALLDSPLGRARVREVLRIGAILEKSA